MYLNGIQDIDINPFKDMALLYWRTIFVFSETVKALMDYYEIQVKHWVVFTVG